MARTARPDKPIELKVSAKVVGHLGKGMYRSPAGALKELVSNAWDADAHGVTIDTGFPQFTYFSCEDDGSGMRETEFETLLDEGVGSSGKRLRDAEVTPSGRPIIGRLGIGLLAVAQLCTEFTIESFHPEEPFAARIRFSPAVKELLDEEKLAEDDRRFPVAKVHWLPPPTPGAGLRVSSNSMRATYVEHMRAGLDLHRNRDHRGKPRSYRSLGELLVPVYASRSLDSLSPYEKMLFNLALYPPLPYVTWPSGNILHKLRAVQTHDAAIRGWQFTVHVDGVELARPVRLPAADPVARPYAASDCAKGKTIKHRIEVGPGTSGSRVDVIEHRFPLRQRDRTLRILWLEYAEQVARRPLRFSCYMFLQMNRLYPRELQGILLRIRGVAIGSYVPDFLGYPKAEGPRFPMITGEVWVETGLEDALNIDRESFDLLHPHYVRVKECVHAALAKVVSAHWQEEKQANRRRREARRDSAVRAVLGRMGFEGADPESVHITDDEDALAGSPLAYDAQTGELVLSAKDGALQTLWDETPRRNQELAKLIAVAFERAQQSRSTHDKRLAFYDMLAEILDSDLA